MVFFVVFLSLVFFREPACEPWFFDEAASMQYEPCVCRQSVLLVVFLGEGFRHCSFAGHVVIDAPMVGGLSPVIGLKRSATNIAPFFFFLA